VDLQVIHAQIMRMDAVNRSAHAMAMAASDVEDPAASAGMIQMFATLDATHVTNNHLTPP
jgi:hypothetical protein